MRGWQHDVHPAPVERTTTTLARNAVVEAGRELLLILHREVDALDPWPSVRDVDALGVPLLDLLGGEGADAIRVDAEAPQLEALERARDHRVEALPVRAADGLDVHDVAASSAAPSSSRSRSRMWGPRARASWCGYAARRATKRAGERRRGSLTPRAQASARCVRSPRGSRLRASRRARSSIFRAVGSDGRVRPDALSDRSVARIVQKVAAAAGLDPATLGAHSLRAGFATTAARKGKSLDAIMRQTLHKSERVARSYVRHGGMFDDNAAVGLV